MKNFGNNLFSTCTYSGNGIKSFERCICSVDWFDGRFLSCNSPMFYTLPNAEILQCFTLSQTIGIIGKRCFPKIGCYLITLVNRKLDLLTDCDGAKCQEVMLVVAGGQGDQIGRL
jgi:hypothetical protein